MGNTVQDAVIWILYEPLGWQRAGGVRRNPAKCAAKVGGWSRFDFLGHQCPNKPKETIEGYGWCNRHAAKLKVNLGEAKDAE